MRDGMICHRHRAQSVGLFLRHVGGARDIGINNAACFNSAKLFVMCPVRPNPPNPTGLGIHVILYKRLVSQYRFLVVP